MGPEAILVDFQRRIFDSSVDWANPNFAVGTWRSEKPVLGILVIR